MHSLRTTPSLLREMFLSNAILLAWQVRVMLHIIIVSPFCSPIINVALKITIEFMIGYY
jgi:hypothetical protein